MKTSSFLALSVIALTAPFASAQDTHRGPPHGGPPAEALAACTSHARDAACSFTGHDGESLTGTCVSPNSSLPLACLPTGGPHGGRPHGPPPEALSACSGIAVGDACALDTPHGDTLEGTCRTTPQGTACMPTHPPHGAPSDAP